MPFELVAVMPVYNERDCIAPVIDSWHQAYSQLGIDFNIIVLNDGSKDDTLEALGKYSADERVQIIDKPNSGHGPTILQGYHLAVQKANWVFQCDSDDELKPEHFGELWKVRDQYDALFGIRSGRDQNAGRKAISFCSRLTVRLLFGSGVADVNVPYRLIRADILHQIVDQIPADTFAPNVIISGAIARAKLRIYNYPIPHENRKTGTVSIMKWKLLRAAFKSFGQTIRCRPTLTSTGTDK